MGKSNSIIFNQEPMTLVKILPTKFEAGMDVLLDKIILSEKIF